jgi:cbb3-type cytochrome oxidase subunit 3
MSWINHFRVAWTVLSVAAFVLYIGVMFLRAGKTQRAHARIPFDLEDDFDD